MKKFFYKIIGLEMISWSDKKIKEEHQSIGSAINAMEKVNKIANSNVPRIELWCFDGEFKILGDEYKPLTINTVRSG